LKRLITPLQADKMSEHSVSRFVNSANNEGAQYIEVADVVRHVQGTFSF
jgi:putative SOS response-associated peptidase YedK